MTIQDTIKANLKDEMRAKNETALLTLRGLLTAFTNELVATKKKPDEALPDEDALNVIRRAVKQRKDAIEQFEKGGRTDLADNEKKELVILETYLPKMMSEAEVRTAVEKKIVEMGGTADKSKLGQIVGMLMKELKGKADGAMVKKVVGGLLTN